VGGNELKGIVKRQYRDREREKEKEREREREREKDRGRYKRRKVLHYQRDN